jgi:hypothetical protein
MRDETREHAMRDETREHAIMHDREIAILQGGLRKKGKKGKKTPVNFF